MYSHVDLTCTFGSVFSLLFTVIKFMIECDNLGRYMVGFDKEEVYLVLQNHH